MCLRRINVKLTLLLVGAFLLGTGLLYALTIFSLVRSLEQEAHNALRARLLRYWAQYEVDGAAAVLQQAEDERFLPGDPLHLVRVTDTGNSTRVFRAPDEFAPVERALAATDRPLGLDEIGAIEPPGYTVTIEIAAVRLAEDLVVQVGASTESRARLLAVVSRNFAVSALAIVLGSAVAGVTLTARMLRPLERLSTAVREIIDTGRMSARIETRESGDDLDALSAAFNEMLARVEGLVEGMKRTLDIVAHDLRTPLTRLRTTAEIALREPEDAARYREALSDCLEESEEIIRLLNAIMDISELESGVLSLDCRSVDLGRLVADVVELYRYPAEERGIEVRPVSAAGDGRRDEAGEVRAGETAAAQSGLTTIMADPARMRQVIGNLLDNAVKYSRPGGVVEVRYGALNRCELPDSPPEESDRRQGDGGVGGVAGEAPEDAVYVEVIDQGIGIAPIELPHVWERLYRGNNTGGTTGLGLGLSLVQAIVTAHGGRVAAESQPGRGSRFVICLPPSGGLPRSGGATPPH